MTLNKREKILAGGAILLLVFFLIYWLRPATGSSYSELSAQRDKLLQELSQNRAKNAAGKKKAAKLAEARAISLPADPQIARNLYQDWLRVLVDKRKWKNSRIEAGDPQTKKGVYTLLTYTVRGQGSLEEVVRFLYEFYSKERLHKIRRIDVKPLEGGMIDLILNIEALSLIGADPKKELSQKPNDQLALKSDEEYVKLISRRNFFAPYVPPPPPPPPRTERRPDPPKPPFDLSEYTFLTGIVESQGIPEVWLMERPTGQIHRLHVGDEFRIGPVQGTVLRITNREVDLEIEGKQVTLESGDRLRNAIKNGGRSN